MPMRSGSLRGSLPGSLPGSLLGVSRPGVTPSIYRQPTQPRWPSRHLIIKMRIRTNVSGAALLDLSSWIYRTAPAFGKRCAQDFKRDILSAPHRPDPTSWPDTGLHAAWLGHSTVLLKVDGVTILTDPVF